MNKMSFKIGLGVVLAGLTCQLVGAAPAGKVLSGHVPSAVAHAANLGELAGTNHLHLAIGLQVRDAAGLDDLLHQVTDPASPNYQHYLTVGEFTERFAPTEADYQAVIAFAKSQGLHISATHSNRMLLEVDGKVGQVQQAFNVSLHNYQHPTENRVFYAPDSEPTVPANLVILDVSGLNNYSRPHSQMRMRSDITNSVPKAGRSNTGSGSFGCYMGGDFRAAYAPGATQTGAGQKVALVQFDGYYPSDIAQYAALNGMTSVPPLTNILIGGYSGNPISTRGNVEVSLDIEMVISMAPGLSQVMVYEADLNNSLPSVVLNQIAVDNAALQISCSWAWSGGPDATTDQIFKEMILQGQSFFTASGDSDAYLPGELDDSALINYPCDDPYVTSVGATTLTTTGPSGAYISEMVWNWGLLNTNLDGQGSSGGASSHYAIPWWQTNVSMTANGGFITHRNIPDVAAVGDNIETVDNGGVIEVGIGGTSCAAPLWAAYTALVNQQAASLSRGSVGFLNPSLYSLGRTNIVYTNVLNDVTIGNNTWSQSPNNFFAVTNYDLCTGLGSPHGTNLINALVANATNLAFNFSAIIPAPMQPWGNTLSVMNGANPNGYWMLYIQDDSSPYSGTNYNGWMLNLTTANPVGYYADNELSVSSSVNSQSFGNATNVIAAPGSLWQVTLAVTNFGPSISTNVYVTDTLPSVAGISLVSSSTSWGSISSYGDSLIWSLTNLAVNASAMLTLNFQVSALGAYTNTAVVSSASTDPNPDDNSIVVSASSAPIVAPVLVPSFLLSAHGFQLSVTNNAGSSVVIQASTNLVTWLPVTTNVAPFTFTNFDSTNFQQRFYRAVIGQ